MFSKRYIAFHVAVMNVGARIFGVLAILAGAYALLAALLDSDNRWLLVVLGLVSVPIGIAFLCVKRLHPDDLGVSAFRDEER